ncbi:MAG TPA: OmpA family protein [Kiloniellales bacterium]
MPDWADPSDWFAADEAPKVVAQDQAPSAGSDKFPNLAGVPDAAPKATQPAARDAMRATLAADRANAEYSGQRLVAETVPEAAKMPSAAGGVLPAGAGEPPAAAAAAAAEQGIVAETLPQAAAAQAEVTAEEPPAPATSRYRFTQFDKPSADQSAALSTPSPVRDSELVAIIYFRYGSVSLNENDRAVLGEVAALQRQRGGTVRVIGHASARTGVVDSVRHRLANLETSLKRANAVAAQLARMGVAKDKIAAEARGDSQPVYHEFMPTGEAGNQRAEIFLEN